MAFQSHLVKIAIFLTLLINLNSSLESFGKAGDPNQATSNYGKTFYVTFNHNPGSLGYPILTLAAESRQASVTVRCLDVSCMFQVSVSSKNTTDVSLPSSIQTKGMGFTNRVVQVTSTENIAVWGNNYRSGSIDSFLVLPRQLYGKRYVVAGYRPTLNSQLSIVASEQDTQINITFPAPITYNGTHYDSQTPLMMMLKAKMAFKYFHQFEDLTGTMITSSQDIAVYSGNECANVPFGQPFCDHLIEQLPSVDDLGTRYIVAGFGGRLGHDIVRITSAMPYTMVYLGNGTSKSLPTRGSHFEFEVNSGTAMYLNCSRPCLLTQYTKGRSVDSTNSDPMMIYIPAIDQYSKDYLFRPTLMLGTEIVHYITIIIEKDQVSGLTLDGNPINSSISWVQAMGTQYVAAAIQVSGLDHQLRHSNPLVTFALLIYGHERVSAYGMLGGVSYGHHCNFAGVPGDLIDNDCDGRTDEELYNGIDDDNDGRIDEDLYRPFPTLYLPQNYTTITCQPMQFNASTEITGMASVGNIDPQCNNDTDIIPYYDDTMIISPCGVQILRKWSVADSCGNVVSGQQSIIARMAGQQSYQFPNHTSGSCPINSSLALNGQPIIEDPTDCPEIQIPQPNVTYQSISVFRCAYYVERIWTITPELLCGPRAQFKQLIRGYDSIGWVLFSSTSWLMSRLSW
ncbi:uncharacterized protein TRIADDRAFT_54093 [Trichoplax adhaerens]|uniref:IgGFc-binding protein N-terminal domain-containing protein n=1 Tax=Trichoplax adhaerens TaxID=10228 RepID=B3RR32_TRIAD|nr:hypothetical protein TRIADDRAFT_54093 [Trichoplax adhaerens]EDV26273.1 hypothetical protein TRIADDRAFT_54093 [Trichoplax adhaerens]|eukprot:XP_002110269.1 hypothetical protein TRIADDRAFT_54093 [Trichoplax adhaerens]